MTGPHVVVVGQRAGQKCIRWPVAFLIASALGLLVGALAGGLYYTVAGEVSMPAIAFGFIGPFITVGSGIVRSMQLPMEALPPLHGTGA